ncbi:anti-sigma factor family protein [Tengunoibacter tsumagoiensis]|uniref:Putative zinc-finger domain-containing protein n=1 Tax=Tengunoibacter tsumagoiensis TaxID=2014871 RepID=A0A402A5Q7_9CHLR|nr:anti-sigma factor [Tengunoibacter tsumagoiensis]GCE14351.1 hypothetical protein KTT_42100 [Tengunoibacter tsumagoiensis]
MQCSRATQQLQLYLDKQLTLEQLRSLEFHLSDCSACRNELYLFEEVDAALRDLMPIVEPDNLTANVMQRVALDVQQQAQLVQKRSYDLFRPSLQELFTVVLLATVVMAVIVVNEPDLRAAIPLFYGNALLSQLWLNVWNLVLSANSNTLMTIFWFFGTAFGVWITLVLAGAEMRMIWYKSVMDRITVW